MKRTKLLTLLLFPLVLCSCGNDSIDMTNWKFEPTDPTNIEIGILQPVEHDALGAARQGFINRLSVLGYKEGQNITITYQNANGSDAELSVLSKSLTSKCDLTLGIGTDATKALYASQINSGSTKPIIFTAVTDAVSAELVDSNENPGGFVTGTIDENPVEEQIKLIKEFLPTAQKVGVIYTASEINSEVQARRAKAEAEKQGLTCVVETCLDSSDIVTVATHLCGTQDVDALYIPTDNNIAKNFTIVKQVCDQYHVLSVCGEEGMVNNGGHITLSVNYTSLGERTADIAASILKGEKKPNEISVLGMTADECTYVMSSENIGASGLTVPDSVASKYTDVSSK